MLVSKSSAGSAPGNLRWDAPGDVVEVDDTLARELLRIPDGGFSEVAAPVVAEVADAAQSESSAERKRPRKPISE